MNRMKSSTYEMCWRSVLSSEPCYKETVLSDLVWTLDESVSTENRARQK